MSKANIAAQRFYGIDLLRLLAAVYVIILHTLRRGGIYNAAVPDSYQFLSCQLLMSVSFCAVNLFGLISGYVGYSDSEKKHNFVSYGMLWLEVVFYGVLISTGMMILFPGTISFSSFFSSFFPVLNNHYWYFTSYTILFFFIPLLNSAVQRCSNHVLKTFFFFALFFFAPIESFKSIFQTSCGYSFLWLMILYLIGAIIRKLRIGHNINPSILLSIIICSIFITFSIYYFTPKLNYCYSIEIDITFLEHYAFPFYLYPSIAYLLLFAKQKLCRPLQSIVSFASPAAFAAYIANVHPLIWNWMSNRFEAWGSSSVPGLLIRVIVFSFLFVIAVVIVDYFRRILFRLLGIQKLLQSLAERIHIL